jgi:hypothetical protein
VDPEFVASQTTSKSNKQRQKEFRDRHRDEAITGHPPPMTGDLFSQASNETLRVTDVTPGEDKESVSEVSGSSSSDLGSEIARAPARETTAPPEPRAEVVDIATHSRRLAADGYEWILALRGNGTAPDFVAHRDWYEKIGRKPPLERDVVARHAAATVYLQEKPDLKNPKHFITYWESFLAGPRNNLGGKPVAKRGPSQVPTQADYEQQAAVAAGGGECPF